MCTHHNPPLTSHQPLTPLSFLERAAEVYPKHIAIIHGSIKRNYSQFYKRSLQLASALSARGIIRGDTVSVILPNTPAMLESHYGVPMCGAVLHSINTRLDPKTIAYQLDHSDSKALRPSFSFSFRFRASWPWFLTDTAPMGPADRAKRLNYFFLFSKIKWRFW